MIIDLFCKPVRFLLGFIDLKLRWRAWLGLNLKLSKRLNGLKDNIDLYTILRELSPWWLSVEWLKPNAKWIAGSAFWDAIFHWVYCVTGREVDLRLLSVKKFCRYGVPVLRKRLQCIPQTKPPITSDEGDLESGIVLHYRSLRQINCKLKLVAQSNSCVMNSK